MRVLIVVALLFVSGCSGSDTAAGFLVGLTGIGTPPSPMSATDRETDLRIRELERRQYERDMEAIQDRRVEADQHWYNEMQRSNQHLEQTLAGVR